MATTTTTTTNTTNECVGSDSLVLGVAEASMIQTLQKQRHNKEDDNNHNSSHNNNNDYCSKYRNQPIAPTTHSNPE